MAEQLKKNQIIELLNVQQSAVTIRPNSQGGVDVRVEIDRAKRSTLRRRRILPTKTAGQILKELTDPLQD